ncbi:MAG: DNA polymerase I [Hormoscilla sp. GM102CHS1]|nr:DNA polymerase I [Hormoscilla sp. GM102CHS1]
MSNSTAAESPPLLLLIDGHSLAFRSYYAFAKSRNGGLRTSTGIPTSVCFGFLNGMLEAIASHKPQAIAVAFDRAKPTFRHEADANYKAGRAETPADFIPDMENLHSLLQALNLPLVTSAGYEADDVLATLAQVGSAAGYRVKVLTGDRDLFGIVDEEKNISVLYLSGGHLKRDSRAKEFGTSEVIEKLGISPAQVVDYKALSGDSSDNISGVRGIGEKTAVKLLKEYGSLDNIYAALENLKGAVKKKLAEGKEAAYHSQYLAQLRLDVPIEISLEDCQLTGFDIRRVEPVLLKLEFKKFLDKIEQLQEKLGGTVTELRTEESRIGIQQQLDINLHKDLGPRIIDTQAKLIALVKQLQGCQDVPVAWDTETTDLKPRSVRGLSFPEHPPMLCAGCDTTGWVLPETTEKSAQLLGIGCCWGTGANDVAYIPIHHATGNNLDLDMVREALRPILESGDYPKAFQNAKFDRLVLRCQGIELKGVRFDTMLASYVLDPEKPHNLKDLSGRNNLVLELKSHSEVVPKGKTIAEVDIPTVAYYCGQQVEATFQLVDKLSAKLKQVPAVEKLLLEVEQPLEPILAEMEYRGIRIDSKYLEELSQQLQKYLAEIEAQAYQEAGDKFNLGSSKQVSQLLFEKLGLDSKKSRKIKTGYSTDAATLEKLQGEHPVVDLIWQYRTLDKLKSTHVDALLQLVRADTQRVHTDFNQTVTGTGRLSSSNPNLQNIPIRTEFSRQIRKAFLPEQDWLLVSADYSQIELRILAHLSQEPVLVEAYRQNEDLHTVTARLLFEKETVTPEERGLGKTINFGVIYGMGAQKFARSAGVTSAAGKEFIQRFYRRYPGVFAYLELVKKEAIGRGYVETILGRRRYFEFENGSLQKMKGRDPEEIDLNKLNLGRNDAGILRAAANAPIQGSSADIIKIAMVKLHQVLQNYQARLLLQVHDELVFEVPPEEWEMLQSEIKTTMASAVELTVPLVVDIHAGDNWMDAK